MLEVLIAAACFFAFKNRFEASLSPIQHRMVVLLSKWWIYFSRCSARPCICTCTFNAQPLALTKILKMPLARLLSRAHTTYTHTHTVSVGSPSQLPNASTRWVNPKIEMSRPDLGIWYSVIWALWLWHTPASGVRYSAVSLPASQNPNYGHWVTYRISRTSDPVPMTPTGVECSHELLRAASLLSI